MGQTDWTFLDDGLVASVVRRGVTAGITPPPGGEDFIFAFNSTSAVEGAVGLFANQVDFAPMALGGSVSGVLQRGPSGGPLGFSPFFFVSCQGTSVNDSAYMLGLSDDDPHRIALRKGPVITGIPDSEGSGMLLSSGDSYLLGTYLHVRLDVVYNENGDVVLQTLINDLDANPLGTPPDWQPIPGMPLFVDDVTGINSGSVPLSPGRAGFGFAVQDVTRRAYFDHIQIMRQVEWL
ncbi:MAG: hypothetical protein GY854_34645 [Deltaproteobacteria bacterium]|nr:hypothetical protein [Deltaproteobacteria bacterium]